MKYPDVIEDNYLYNRSHLIAYSLAGENANEKNLITGTRYFNQETMQIFELKVLDYVRENDQSTSMTFILNTHTKKIHMPWG